MLLRGVSTSMLVLLTCLGTQAQVEMREPPPRRSKFSKFYISADNVDYNMKSPLGGKIGYPCRNTSAGPVQGTLVAGQNLKMFFDGTATRQGGDCQFAISYDNGENFAVIWDKLSNCFLDTVNGGYEVPIPERLPASKSAVLAWSWIPSISERAYYMNCADVRIENYGKQQKYTAKELLVVNVPGKPKLLSAKYPDKDTLPDLLDARPLITVGDPVKPAGSEVEADENESAETNEDIVDEQEDEGLNDSNPGTVILYVSETTVTSTQVVYISEYITEEMTNNQGMYTYSARIQTKGELFTTLGPYVKPMFGTNVGLTIVPDSTDIPTPTAMLSFTEDWAIKPLAPSEKWPGAESLDFIVPSVSGPQTPTATPTSSRQSIDIMLTDIASGHDKVDVGYGLPNSTFVAGTPLFDLSAARPLTGGAKFTDPKLGSAETGVLPKLSSISTNRPLFKSVTDTALLNKSDHLRQMQAGSPRATTILSTMTKDGKLVLQVIVSMENTDIPESMTLAL
ncbi:hypothetical protein LPJ66_003758 [Kickxella alabastrina]|uniref:Uncharacterized protein n=1 Tax=Kickxella alabastrina TaxID=61397 RepID=A0ACC1IIV8_9FUNG|nr:hypothetical protein LPJ66_003758 [Kickxella alabastrina]